MKRLVLLIVLTITLFGLKAQNPNCPYKYGATPEDSLLSLERITYFQTFYNQKNYKEAYIYINKALKYNPSEPRLLRNKELIEKLI